MQRASGMEDSNGFVRRVLIVVGIATAATLLTLLAWRGLTALLVTFAGILLGVLLRSLAQLLQRRWALGNGAALAVVCVVLLVLVAGGAVLFAIPLQAQVADMYDELPRAWARLREQLASYPLGQRLLSQAQDGTPLADVAAPAARQVMQAASRTATFVGYVVLVLFTGLFLAAEPDVYRRGLLRLFPVERRARLRDVLDETGESLQRWLVGRAFLMLVITACTWIGLMLLGVPLAFALAVLAGLLTFIPNFGPIIAAVPAFLLALLEGPTTVLWVGLLYLGLQTVESYTLEPWVMRKADDLPPALVVVGQLFLGVTLGALGLVLATPLIVVLTVLVKRLYVEDVLEG